MLILWFASPFYHSLPENATRSRVPRLNAPMGTPRPHVSRHVSGRAPRRGRRPRRPASAHLRIPAHSRLSLRRGGRPRRPVRFSSKGRDVSRSGATSFCPRRQKDAKTPPKTHGLWNSFTPNVIRRKMAHKESPPRLSPLPLPRTARVACYDRLRDSAIRAAAAPTHRAAVRWLIGGVLACRSAKYASQQRIFRGPTGRTCTCRRWRQVRDLIIAKIGRPTRPHFALQER